MTTANHPAIEKLLDFIKNENDLKNVDEKLHTLVCTYFHHITI